MAVREDFGNIQIPQFIDPARGFEDVGRFDIPVYDIIGMQILECYISVTLPSASCSRTFQTVCSETRFLLNLAC